MATPVPRRHGEHYPQALPNKQIFSFGAPSPSAPPDTTQLAYEYEREYHGLLKTVNIPLLSAPYMNLIYYLAGR